MSQTVTVPTKTLDEIFSRLDELTKAVKTISIRLFREELPYGSNEWWDKEIEEAEKEFKKGKGTIVHNQKELAGFFKNL